MVNSDKGLTTFYTNRKLIRQYQCIDSIIAGIILSGWEIRAIFAHQFSLENAFAVFQANDLYLLNFKIIPVQKTMKLKPAEKHKLLLTKQQFKLWYQKKVRSNYTIIPSHIVLKNGKLKIKLFLAKGLKKHETKKVAMAKEWRKKAKHSFRKE